MPAERPHVLLAVANLIGLILVVVVNALANALPIAGRTTGELSDALPNLFVPAGMTFSIWGLIYLLLAIFIGYTLIGAIRKSEASARVLGAVGPFFLVTCLANAGWIFAWHYRLLPLSLLLMGLLLFSLIVIYRRLEIGKAGAAGAEKYLAHLPMSVYLGWITIATIANVTAVLVAYGWDGLGAGAQLWTSVMITIGVALALVALALRSDIFYALVVDWALIGILIKRTVQSEIRAPLVVAAALAGIVVLSAAVLLQLARRKVYR